MSGNRSEGLRRSYFEEGSRGFGGIGVAIDAAFARIFDLKSSSGARSQLSAFTLMFLPEKSGGAKLSNYSFKKTALIPILGTRDIFPLNFSRNVLFFNSFSSTFCSICDNIIIKFVYSTIKEVLAITNSRSFIFLKFPRGD
jgi:hypothetical protein